MELVELVADGVRGLPPRARLGFDGQVNVLRLPDPARRSLLIDLLFHLLFPDPDRPDATRDLGDPQQPNRRALLTLVGRDRVAYRVLRQLESGRTRLYRFDRSRKGHVLLSEDGREVAQFLRVEFGLPDDPSYERLFVLAEDNRPSLGANLRSRSGAELVPGAWVPPASGPGLPGAAGISDASALSGRAGLRTASVAGRDPSLSRLTGAFPLPESLREGGPLPSLLASNALVQQELEISGTIDLAPGDSDEALLSRRRALSDELHRARRAERLAADLEALAVKEEAARAEAAELERLEAEVERRRIVRPGDRGTPTAETLERLRRLEASVERAPSEIAELEQQRHALGPTLPPPGRWSRDPWVVLGLAGAAVGGAGAVALAAPWLALVQAVGGAVAGYGAVRRLDAQGRFAARSAQVQDLEERAERRRRQQGSDTQALDRALAALAVEGLDELEARLFQASEAEAETERLEQQIAGAAGERGRQARARLAELAERRRSLEASLFGVEVDGTPASLAKRIEAVDAELLARGVSPQPSVRAWAADDDDEEETSPLAHGDGYQCAAGSASPVGLGYRCAAGAGGLGGGFSGGHSYAAGPEPSRAVQLVTAAADLLGRDLDETWAEVRDRFSRFVHAMSGRRFSGGELGVNDLALSGEEATAYQDLSGPTLDRVDAALRFSLLESVLRVRAVPVLIVDPVAPLPPSRRRLLLEIYRHLGRFTQVLVFTAGTDVDGHRMAGPDAGRSGPTDAL